MTTVVAFLQQLKNVIAISHRVVAVGEEGDRRVGLEVDRAEVDVFRRRNLEPMVNQTLEPLSSLVNIFFCFFATSPIRARIPAYMCSASHSHRCAPRILSLTPMPQPGIELMSVQLHLFEGPLLRMLYQLSYPGRGFIFVYATVPIL